MKAMVATLADRALALIVPRAEAEAGCSYVYTSCYCQGGLRYRKRCMSGCSGVPNHCYPCIVTGSC